MEDIKLNEKDVTVQFGMDTHPVSDARVTEASGKLALMEEKSLRPTDIPQDFGVELGEQRVNEKMWQEEYQYSTHLSNEGNQRQAIETLKKCKEGELDMRQEIEMNLQENKKELLSKLLEKIKQLEQAGNFDGALALTDEIEQMDCCSHEETRKLKDTIKKRQALSFYDKGEKVFWEGDAEQAKLHLAQARHAHPLLGTLVEHRLLSLEKASLKTEEIEVLRCH